MSDIIVIFPGSVYHHPITTVLTFGINKANLKFIIKMQTDLGAGKVTQSGEVWA